MSERDNNFPTWPPGLWRRIELHPGPDRIAAGLEDDVHRFHLWLEHSEGRITSAQAEAVRIPWTGCAGAPGFIERELTGALLADVAGRNPREHCTHLLDLAIVAAAHACDEALTIFDMQVADRVEGLTSARLLENGEERLHWPLRDTVIAGTGRFSGLDLRHLSQWKQNLPMDEAEWATLLRRAVFVSGARSYRQPTDMRASDMGPTRMGVCYNYQSPQVEVSEPTMEKRDFSMTSRKPLEGFSPEAHNPR